MNKGTAIKEFLNQKRLAVVGVSRSEKKFGSMVYKNLKNKGYHIFPVNPSLKNIGEEKCYENLSSIPDSVDGVLIVVPPSQTENVVKEALALNIKNIWIQQGAESQRAIELCQNEGVNLIHNQCILMFAEPTTFPHNLHRGIWRLLGKLPE